MGIEDGVSDDVRVVYEKSMPADASAFGLGAFAGTMYILSSYLAGWAPDVTWVTVALFYGGLGQFVAGMWQYKRGCVFSSTSFSTYGCFWMSIGLFYCFQLGGWLPEGFDLSGAEAWFLLAFLLFNTYMLAAAFTISVVNVIVFGLYELTLICLVIGDFKGQPVDGKASWITAGGYIGVFTSIAAWYASFAVLFNQMVNREIMYLGKPLINIKKEE